MPPYPAATKKRHYYLDVIKILCLTFVFLFHCYKIFDADSWHIKNDLRFNIRSGYVYELGLAVMPGFFVISGASIWFSMQKRTGFVFLQNIFKRFFFPLLFGHTVLAIPQVYFEHLSNGKYNGSLFNFFPYYFEQLQTTKSFFWAVHLWFLVLLFLFSMLLLPFFVVGKKVLPLPQVQKIIKSPFILLLLVALVVVPGWKLHPHGPLGTLFAGWNLFQNLIFFAAGFVLFSSPQFIPNCQRHKWWMLALAVTLTLLCMHWYQHVDEAGFRTPFYTFKLVVKAVACWAWISSVLGIASQYFAAENRVTTYWTVAALPFYILSQPVIVAVGFFVVKWPLPLFGKLCLITAASFVITLLLYEGIKRNGALRWLFGVPRKGSVRSINQKVLKPFLTKKEKEGTAPISIKQGRQNV